MKIEVSRNTWFKVSATECAASASMALEPVRMPATTLMTATTMLAAPAIITVRLVSPDPCCCLLLPAVLLAWLSLARALSARALSDWAPSAWA